MYVIYKLHLVTKTVEILNYLDYIENRGFEIFQGFSADKKYVIYCYCDALFY